MIMMKILCLKLSMYFVFIASCGTHRVYFIANNYTLVTYFDE